VEKGHYEQELCDENRLEKIRMNFKDITYKIKPPCPKCPYKLGLVKTLVNPCPNCKMNDYKSFERFQKQLTMGYTSNNGDAM